MSRSIKNTFGVYVRRKFESNIAIWCGLIIYNTRYTAQRTNTVHRFPSSSSLASTYFTCFGAKVPRLKFITRVELSHSRRYISIASLRFHRSCDNYLTVPGVHCWRTTVSRTTLSPLLSVTRGFGSVAIHSGVGTKVS